jgi:hypothetical protein
MAAKKAPMKSNPFAKKAAPKGKCKSCGKDKSKCKC